MKKGLKDVLNSKTARTVGPWVLTMLIIVVLRVTGMAGPIAGFVQLALVQTGVLNVDVEEETAPEDFDYNFEVQNLDGRIMHANELRGKVVFINLWATWCPPCRAEMPSIQKLYDQVNHDSVAFVMLSIDKANQKHKVKNYIEENEFTFPVYTLSGPVPKMMQVPSIPTTFVVGIDGKVRLKSTGTNNYNTKNFKKFLRKLMRETSQEKAAN